MLVNYLPKLDHTYNVKIHLFVFLNYLQVSQNEYPFANSLNVHFMGFFLGWAQF